MTKAQVHDVIELKRFVMIIAKTHVVGKIEHTTAIVNQTFFVLNTTRTT